MHREVGDIVVVFLNSMGRMDPKLKNGQMHPESRLQYAMALLASGNADIVGIGDAQLDSAKCRNVQAFLSQKNVTAYFGLTSSNVSTMEHIVAGKCTSSSISGGTMILMRTDLA